MWKRLKRLWFLSASEDVIGFVPTGMSLAECKQLPVGTVVAGDHVVVNGVYSGTWKATAGTVTAFEKK